MRALIGLGNPGSEYDGTRHNIGFAVVDALAEALNVRLRRGSGFPQSGTAQAQFGGKKILLVQPRSYMNNSGEEVKAVVETHGLGLDDLLIIVDDFHLPLGTLRMRLKGSDGGHNGLYSVIEQLGSNAFPRLRCGIGGETMPKDKKELARYVLSPFEQHEREAVRRMITRARDAALVAAGESVEAAISRFNGLPT
ncbi:MAG: aminoacyl-tRNA hydrolase [Ignavibacteria bacterium 13_1_40CM_2_61_4]|nr:MAG: aminoacyl-tRNA hydrolase [Ignavibacteria bacterium 13_1_40CM_2_61_4]